MILTKKEIKEYRAMLDSLPPNHPNITKIAQLLKADKIERCKDGFMPFVGEMWSSFISGRHHAIMADAFERVAEGKLKRLIINMPPRHAIMLDMKIPTISGMKTMASLQVGDYVFGPDGKPVAVLGKSEVFVGRELYRVWTDDGAYLDVDGEHLWTVRLDRKHSIFNNYTTEQLWRRQNGEILRTKRGGGAEFIAGKIAKKVRLARLPDFSPVEYPEKLFCVDPYVLGVWLGDGTSKSGVITSHPDDAVFVRKEFEKRGIVTTEQSTPFTFGTLKLQASLQKIGVLGNKHIPQDYLEASVSQRRDLLKGLMDTDGNVSKEGQCFFAQSNYSFIMQVAQLVRSLGIKASVLESEAKIGSKTYGKTWKLSFYASNVFNLPRKELRTLTGSRHFGRYIQIEKLNKTGKTQCIKVDREDGLFLAGDGYICTHNTKSEFASFLFPAWYLGKFPERKIIQTAHTAELAVGFGRKVRNIVSTPGYQAIFPTKLSSDSKAAGRWNTNKGGDYFAIGVGGAVTGKGADVLIIDDPHSEQEAMQNNPAVYDRVYEWFSSGPRQRLQPGGSIIVVATRWSKRDLTGQILANAAKRDGDEWEVIEFPALMPSGAPLWPEFWSQRELEAIRNELPVGKWEAQYQQNPTSEEGAIIKRDMWKIWEKEDPPPCDYIIQSWDTAFEKHSRADYSACTTWGVFYQPNSDGMDVANIILLDAVKARLEFPDLKRKAMEMWKEWSPDSLIIEKKAAGAPLIYELRQMGIPLSEYTPSRGNDKIARVNAISDLFASGLVWCPETRWAEELVEEVASFPNGDNDDLVDSTSQALLRFRQGGFIRLQSDEPEEEKPFKRRLAYY